MSLHILYLNVQNWRLFAPYLFVAISSEEDVYEVHETG